MFRRSLPVWAAGGEKQINLHLEFIIAVPEGGRTVRMTASTAYQLYRDGEFVTCGPARAGDGYFRVDEWDISGAKELRVLVAGYYSSSFQYNLYPSFLNLEIEDEKGGILFATGRDAAECREYVPRLRFTDRQARQRVYTEVYDFNRVYGFTGLPREVSLAVQPDPKYLPRRVPALTNAVICPVKAVYDYGYTRHEPPEEALREGSPFNRPGGVKFQNPDHGPRFENEECNLFAESHALEFSAPYPAAEGGAIRKNTARLYDFGRDLTGLICIEADVRRETEVYLIFDELMQGDDIKPRRSNCLDCVKYTLAPHDGYKLITFEPYTLRYLKICVSGSDLELKKVYLIEQASAPIASVQMPDKELQMIYDAAVSTYRQNVTDIYMDCPSRERAGWLCDSFFTGRSEYLFTGGTAVETNFLENFAYHDPFHAPADMPEGMVPMLYPGSTDYIPGGNWIANWALWLVMETGEYALKRHGDAELVKALKPVTLGIIDSFAPYINEMGLIENMPGWIFVEWSHANDKECVCGVNWPTNMLYAGALEAAGRAYGDDELIRKGAALKAVIRENAFNGRFFCDNSVRKDGVLTLTGNTTEACQYYALFFGIADRSTHPELINTLVTEFGPQRKQTNAYPDVAFANSFIGNYLRLDALMALGFRDRVIEEIRGYFGYMAEANGALWEYDTPRASCCHGFASHAAVWLRS